MVKYLANSFTARFSMAAALAAAMLFTFPAWAQNSRLSLADRVALLEQRAQNKDQSAIGMVNQVQQLTAQVRQLEGRVEELQHHLQQLEDKSKAQYVDLDSRLARLEKSGSAASSNSSPASASTASAPVAAGSVNPASAASAGAVAGGSDAAAAQSSYDVAFKGLQSGDYAQASRDFRAFIKKYPDNALTPNAWYWLGESYYVTMNYQVALQSFQQIVKQFPQSEKVPDAMLKVGYCQFELKQVDKAKATLTEVTTRYPGSSAASLARERLHRIQLQSAN